MAKTYTYAFPNVMTTVNGYAVRGFWEGDNAVEVTPGADAATMLVGADGDATFSFTADESAMITLRLKPDSPMNRILAELLARGRAGALPNGFPIAVRNTGNGEGGAAAEAHVLQVGSRSFGTNATVREWTIGAASWAWTNVDYAAQ